jgi:hypothetical protein
MNEEEKKKLEDAAKVAREAADTAHEAAAQADGVDEALNSAADTAEDAALEAQAAFDAAVVTPEPEAPAPAPEDEDDKDIDFEKELENLGGEPPKEPGKKLTELQKAERALFFQTQKVKELGGDPTKVIKTGAPIEPVPPAPQPAFVTKDDLNKRDLQGEIRKLSRTEAERKVTEWHAENSIKLTGDPVKDAENAYLIAHKGRITRSFDEIRRASFSRPMHGAGPGRKPPAAATKAPELQSSEKAIMQRRGYTVQPDGSWEAKRFRMRYDTSRKGWVTEKKT